MTHSGTYEYEWTVKIHYRATEGTPAVTGGPPDGWAPEEPAELELWVESTNEDFRKALEAHLDENRQELESTIWDHIDEEVKGIQDAADEAKYEEWKEREHE